ncbi:putative MFS transporter [Actinoplanes missouriensis 431]|uniref:Putative MFS transporter n=1 Tax=Actinoplanes missouriensis (strain ATCC 14538 / DSM 43046 / CBS 188.64 / JCM 3121 / NBRC 102363 / NCIMB 12654 / NRRL B-3342 / UNCC 431) TaxID=512565 RepID=I0H1G8_ACTM4|nr:MFS transporter [Actinoplanes missouriensis]BAL86855.1 putative MFS transporter [Actinoplanes missouriensis 431]
MAVISAGPLRRPFPRPAPTSNRQFAILLAAEGISMLGSRITFVALPWLVLTSTDSALLAGVAGFAEMLPYVLSGLIGGPIVDRVGPRPTAVAADTASVLAVAGIPIFAFYQDTSLTVLILLIALAGALRGFGDAAKRALLPRTIAAAGVSTERGTTLYDGVARASTLIGLPLAGLLIAALGPSTVLLFDAATFGVAALLIGALVRVGAADAAACDEQKEQGYAAALRNGFRYVRADRLILGVMSLLFVTNMFDQAYATVFIPVWVRDGPHGPAALGVVGTAFGLGAVAGNILYTVFATRLPRRLTFGICFFLGGPAQLLALALTDRVWVVLATAAISGALMSTVNPILLAAVYRRIPVHMHGRVISVLISVSWAGIPLGGVLGGWATDVLGLRTAALLAAIGYLAVTAAPFVFPAWQALDRTDPVPKAVAPA